MPESPHEKMFHRSGSSSVWRYIARYARLAVVLYLLVCLMITLLERKLVYLPPPPQSIANRIQAMGGEEVWFAASDATKLHGWYFPNPAAKHAILYAHGNGEDAEQNADYMAYLREELRASIFVFDYRGYGFSEGVPDEAGLILDGLAAQQWLAEKQGRTSSELVLLGRSLGGGVMVAVAEQAGAQALIVHSSFANMVDIGARAYPFLPVRLLMKNRFHSEQRIKNYPGPLLQLHGTEDELIPLALAKPLYEASPSEHKQFLEIPGSSHNDILPEDLLPVIRAFLDQSAN